MRTTQQGKQARRKLAHTFRLAVLFLVLALSLLACDMPVVTIGGNSATPTTGLPGNVQFHTWYTVARGVEIRYEDWKDAGGDEDTVSITRFNPRDIRLSVAYQPGQPLMMSQWMQQESALAIINGGYFDANNLATALVISNGQAFGSSYSGFGGMLSVDTRGRITLRSLHDQPYDPNEQLTQAVQSSPTLMLNGKRTQFNADASQSRRSVVAIDRSGNLLFIASPDNIFSLDSLADLLVSSDLSIVTALNLDGGASTGLYVKGSQQIAIDSFVKLPTVVIIKAR